MTTPTFTELGGGKTHERFFTSYKRTHTPTHTDIEEQWGVLQPRAMLLGYHSSFTCQREHAEADTFATPFLSLSLCVHLFSADFGSVPD